MSEIFNILNEHKVDAPDLIPERTHLELLPPHMLDDFIDDCATKIVEVEDLMRMAIEIKESRERDTNNP